MSEQKGAYAHGTLPGMRELVKVVDENKALQGEVQRLRRAIEEVQFYVEKSVIEDDEGAVHFKRHIKYVVDKALLGEENA